VIKFTTHLAQTIDCCHNSFEISLCIIISELHTSILELKVKSLTLTLALEDKSLALSPLASTPSVVRIRPRKGRPRPAGRVLDSENFLFSLLSAVLLPSS